MKTNSNSTTKHWAVCKRCHGQGQVLLGPSRRRIRHYKKQMRDAFSGKLAPPDKRLNACPECTGSGLSSAEADVSPNLSYPHIAIIGGGIGGTALAVACLHRGIPFTLYERDVDAGVRSQGYGLTLQQASKAIEGFGVLNLENGITSTKHVVYDQHGDVIGEWGLRKWKHEGVEPNTKRKNVHIAREKLRSALFSQLRQNNSIKWGHRFTALSKDEAGGFDLEFQVGKKTAIHKTDLIVGADGIRSSVRDLLIDADPLQYLGCIVILGICPLKSLGGINSELLDSATVFQMVNGHERIYMMPYDDKNIMWQLSFPMDEGEAKDLSMQGQQAMRDDALKRLGEWHNPIPQILEATRVPDITGYPVYDRTLFDTAMLRDSGNITLLGDAAHPMSPFKGQGANQALLDALGLARRIHAECGPESNWREKGLRELLLNEFEREMAARTASKVQDSRKAVELLHSDAVLHEGDEPRGRGIKK